MLAALIMFSAICFQVDPLETKITFETVATPLESALKNLSKSCPVNLASAEVLQKEIVLLRLRDVSLKEAMDRIATATGGVWIKTNNGFLIKRPDDFRQQLESRNRSLIRASLVKDIAARKIEATNIAKFDPELVARSFKKAEAILHQNNPPDYQTTQRLTESTPMGRLAKRITAALDPEQLSRIPLGTRVILSTTPNSLEWKLQLTDESIVNSFVKEQAAWSEAAERVIGKDGSRAETYDTALTGLPSKILVIASNSEFARGIDLTIRVFDSAGEVVGNAAENLRLVPSPQIERLSPAKGEVAIQIPEADDATLHFIASSFLAITQGIAGKAPSAPTGILDRIANPDQIEPLAGFTSSLILALAKEKDLNVVADLPDFYYGILAVSASQGKPTTGSVLRALQLVGDYVPTKIDAKWLELDGAWTSDVYSLRVDRPALGRLLRAARENRVSIEDRAQYAATGGGGVSDVFDLFLVPALSPETTKSDPFQNHDELSLVGRLWRLQGTEQIQSGRFPLAGLDPALAATVFHIVFETFPRVTVNSAHPDAYSLPPDPFNREAVEMFPNGFPRDTVIEIKESRETVAFSDDYSPDPHTIYRGNPMSPAGVAVELYRKAHETPSSQDNNGAPTIDQLRFKMGVHRTISLEILLKKDVVQNCILEERQIPSGDYVPYASLPADFKKLVEAKLSAMERLRTAGKI